MDWKRAARHARRGVVSAFGPIWQLHHWLGPMSVVFSVGISVLIGFLTKSPAWGIVAILAILLALTFADVVRRERRDDKRFTSDLEKESESIRLACLHSLGEMELSRLSNCDFLFKYAKTDEEFDKARERSSNAIVQAREWMKRAEDSITRQYNAQTALLFRTHQNVTLTSAPPPEMQEETRRVWEKVSYRLAWIANRIADIEERRA